MELTSSWWYKGPLSQEAKRVLAALRAQNRYQNLNQNLDQNRYQNLDQNRSARSPREMERSECSQGGGLAPSSWSQVQEKEGNTDWSRPQVFPFSPSDRYPSNERPTPQTPESSQPSCWGSALQKPTPQTYYQTDPAPWFGQTPETEAEFSNGDGLNFSLHTKGPDEPKETSWRKRRPSFPGEPPDEEVPDERRVSASFYPQISEQTDWNISRREPGEASAQKQPPSIPAEEGGDGPEENQQLEPETVQRTGVHTEAHGAPDPDGAGLKEVRGETETRSRAGTGEQAGCRVDKITCSEIQLEKTTEEKIEDPKPGGKGEDRELPLLPPWGREQHSRSTEAERGPSGGASRRPGAKPPGFRPPRPRGNRQAGPTGAEGPSGGAESSSVDPAASAKPGNLEIRNLYLAWCQSREPPRKRKRDAFQLPNKKPRPEVHQTGPAPSEPPTLTPEPAAKSEGLSEPPGISNSDPPRTNLQVWPSKVEETSEETPLVKPRKRAKTGPGSSFQAGETPWVFDGRVKDPGKLLPEERTQMLEKAGEAQMVALTMVYQDGTTQLDPEQKPPPPVCGLLVLMKSEAPCDPPEDSLGPNDDLIHLKLEHTPLWAQQPAHHTQELFTREMLLRILSRSQPVVCYKAKDFLRTALQFDRQNLDWNHVAGVRIHDPQVSGWLLDPADPWSDFRGLLQKHCETGSRTPAPGAQKVSHIISDLCWLYKLNMKLCSKLQSRGLWRLFSDMELKMIPVLAAMESHHIHVDKEALRRTSDLLGAKMKQLEQEAHRAAGQIFLVTSSSQLRTVLFEKLRLHERCESKKLPKTFKQQQSTSEAALLLLQDLHPLPKIILEHRQVHKIKSTFVDGILSCIRSKNYISSTWHQTSAVTGRISSKQPNFQALPRQPLQVRKKQHVHGKEEEVVTVHPRAMFIPQEGWTFLSADFCQVELRLLAHLSCDPELLRIFSDPQADVFSMLASQWKGMAVGEVTSEDREHAKRIVYSVVYGAGRERLSGILGVSAEQASRFQDGFLQKYRDVQAFVQRTIQQSHKQGYVLSIMGRRRSLPNIDSPDWGLRMQAERQAVNFVVQGSAADLCKMAMIQIFNLVSSSSSPSARLLAQLHDELLYEVEDSQVEPFAALVRSTMESLQHIDHLGVHLKVPLKVSVSSGKSWGSMSELLPPS